MDIARCNDCDISIRCATGSEAVCPICKKQINSGVWVNAVKRFRSKGDKGVGDTVARIFAMFGAEYLKSLAKKIGMPCGCTERQAEWNERWPY